MSYNYKFKAGFTKGGTATTPANAPTIDILDVAGGSLVVTAGTPTAIAALPGFYHYTYAGTAGMDFVALFKTVDTTMDQMHLHSYIADVIETNLDAAVTSRLAPTVAARTLDVTATGAAGVDWGNVENKTTTNALTNTTILSAGSGQGASTEYIVCNDGTDPLDGVEVWISTDAAGSNIVASGQTDTGGSATFYLDPGTYYTWKQLSGYNFSNPGTITVT